MSKIIDPLADPLGIHPLKFIPEIPIIAITGGPCGAKSSVLARAGQMLQDMNISAGMLPEVATEFATHGFTCGGSMSVRDFQKSILLASIEREHRAHAMMTSRVGKNKVLLTDRGRLDGSAYMNREEFFSMAATFGYDASDLGEIPYKGVIHLRSLAHDIPELYSVANNMARHETVVEACALDEATLAAWQAHPHLRVIGNLDVSGNPIGLEEKTRKVIQEVARILGVPVPLEIERKFCLKIAPIHIPVPHEVVTIVQCYLDTPSGEERLRIRTWRGQSVYYHTIKKPLYRGAREEVERIISFGEFTNLLSRAAQNKRPVTKRRIMFVWQNQYFELDIFTGFYEGLIMLEIELTDLNGLLLLPEFIGPYEEVTGIDRYSNASLAGLEKPFW